MREKTFVETHPCANGTLSERVAMSGGARGFVRYRAEVCAAGVEDHTRVAPSRFALPWEAPHRERAGRYRPLLSKPHVTRGVVYALGAKPGEDPLVAVSVDVALRWRVTRSRAFAIVDDAGDGWIVRTASAPLLELEREGWAERDVTDAERHQLPREQRDAATRAWTALLADGARVEVHGSLGRQLGDARKVALGSGEIAEMPAGAPGKAFLHDARGDAPLIVRRIPVLSPTTYRG